MALDRIVLFVHNLNAALSFTSALGLARGAAGAGGALIHFADGGPRVALVERSSPAAAAAPPAVVFSVRVRAPTSLDALVPALLAPHLGAHLAGAIVRRPTETVATVACDAIPGALFSLVEVDEEALAAAARSSAAGARPPLQ
jgi:hypothetical protein